MTNQLMTKPKIELQTCSTWPLLKKYYNFIVMICDFHVVCERYQITHGAIEEFVLNPVCVLDQHKQASMTSLTTKS